MFPVENEDLIYGHWENDIIWDNSVCLISCQTLPSC
jgi:hypothetical protein